MPFIVNHGSVGVVRYDPERVARQFGYDQGVPLVHISFCSFKECLVRYFIASSDDFIWGHLGSMIASPGSSSSRLNFLIPALSRVGLFIVKNHLFWEKVLTQWEKAL